MNRELVWTLLAVVLVLAILFLIGVRIDVNVT